jgi:hypothetical protein
VACSVESTLRVAIVRKCTVNEQPVLIVSTVRDKTFDSFDDLVTTLRTAREETSWFDSRRSLRGVFFITVYRTGSGAHPASYPKGIAASFHFGNATVSCHC